MSLNICAQASLFLFHHPPACHPGPWGLKQSAPAVRASLYVYICCACPSGLSVSSLGGAKTARVSYTELLAARKMHRHVMVLLYLLVPPSSSSFCPSPRLPSFAPAREGIVRVPSTMVGLRTRQFLCQVSLPLLLLRCFFSGSGFSVALSLVYPGSSARGPSSYPGATPFGCTVLYDMAHTDRRFH